MEPENFSKPLDLHNVRLTDSFWGREQELVRTEVLPYQWKALNDQVEGAAPSYCMHNFRAAARRRQENPGGIYAERPYPSGGIESRPENPDHPEEDCFYGFVFQDSDFSKWIEAVAYSLALHPDPELEKTADEAIDIVCAAQLENGYLDTYYIINGMDRAFTNLRDHHELYCFGHLAEGAAAYFQATGKRKLLDAAVRFADYIDFRFGPEEGKCKGYPGHEIAELALARLYEITGEKRYLDLSRFFLDMRGSLPYYFDLEEKERAEYEGRAWVSNDDPLRYTYHQANRPVRELQEAEGHAVRAVYLYSGMADAARLTGDEELYRACLRLWDSIAGEKMYVTGGIGGTHVGEAFSFPFDLPNDTAYAETCAAIGLVFFARRMLQIKPESRFADVMERALYNGVLSGMSLDGKSFFYVNPLEVEPEACRRDARKAHVKPVRQKWFGCACCPPNLARLIESAGSYAYTEGEAVLWIHLYMGGIVKKSVNGRCLELRMESGFPWDGRVSAELKTEAETRCTLAFRVPGWCGCADISVVHGGRRTELLYRGEDGAKEKEPENDLLSIRMEEGYLYLTADWEDGDRVELDFPMEVCVTTADPRVRDDIGKAAFLRGPVVYCLEEADNGKNLHLCRADLSRIGADGESVSVEAVRILGHEMRVLKAPGKRQIIREGSMAGGRPEELYRACEPGGEQDTVLTMIPYYAWNNRGEGEMAVWVRY